MQRIAEKLNAEGHTTRRGKPWNPVQVMRVLERAKPFMSDEHFTVDGTLIEAWASQKSFRRKTIARDSRATGQTLQAGEWNVPRHGR